MPKTAKSDRTEKLPVAERFVSINGEGPFAGKPSAFIRFVGCNLTCSYCDTRWACDLKCPCEWLDAWALAQWVSEIGVHHVTLTGGEPLLHPILGELLRRLVNGSGPHDLPYELPEDLVVEIETNGSVSLNRIGALLNFLPKSQSERIVFTVDYKLPGSGMESKMDRGVFASLGERDAVKFVVSDRKDLDRMRVVAEKLNLWNRTQVFVSPVFGAIEPAQIARYLIDNKLFGARLQLQLHKVVWPGVERGV